MSVRVPAPAFYIDELYRTDVSDAMAVLNAVPQDTETNVPKGTLVSLHAVTLTDGTALSGDIKVWLTTSSDSVRHLVYDQASGGFQSGWDGARSSATLVASPDSGGNDELWLVIDRTTDFASLEVVYAEVEGSNDGAGTLSTTYSFVIEDLTRPEITDIVWLSPRKARLEFSEPVISTAAVGGSRFITAALSGVQIVSTSQIVIPGVTPSSDWIGYSVGIHNSHLENAGPWVVTAVDTTTGYITLNTSGLVVDDGNDWSDTGTLVVRRNVAASISPYYLAARLSSEGASSEDPAQTVQCTFLPIPIELTEVTAEELPAGESPSQYVYVKFIDDVSINRLYTIHGTKVQDLYDNEMDDSTLDFTAPSFGYPDDRLAVWEDGHIPGSDRKWDLENDKYLRGLAVIIEDLLHQLWYRIDEVPYLDDAHRCQEDWIEHLLYELGNPFRFPLDTELLKRKLANALPGFYKKIGTVPGIKNMLYLLLRIDFEVIPYISADYWVLGYSRFNIGQETTLGPGTAWAKNAYEIISPVDLTAAQRRIVTDVATWADPADMHLFRIVEPSSGEAVVSQYWVLGTSALGLSTTLAG